LAFLISDQRLRVFPILAAVARRKTSTSSVRVAEGTVFPTSRPEAAAASGSPQESQKRAPSRFSAPQLAQTVAELLRRLDRVEDARAAYDRALELVHSDAERRFLEQRLAELQG
jgi:hypothetical protein